MTSGHFGIMNVLFCDGHVIALKATQTATPHDMWIVMDDGPMDTTVGAWVNTYSLQFQGNRFNN